jgi:hypothetical protein
MHAAHSVTARPCVQGKCARQAVPAALEKMGAPLATVPPGVCILGAQRGVFRMAAASHIVWLDALYLKGAPVPEGSAGTGAAPRLLDMSGSSSLLFATNLVLQGVPSVDHAVGLWEHSSAMHFEGVRATPTPVAVPAHSPAGTA